MLHLVHPGHARCFGAQREHLRTNPRSCRREASKFEQCTMPGKEYVALGIQKRRKEMFRVLSRWILGREGGNPRDVSARSGRVCAWAKSG